jgi:galactose mutarotase-like enzyme
MPRNEYPTRNASLHGYLCGQPMTLVSTNLQPTLASLSLAMTFDGSDIFPGYPFTFHLQIEYTLTSSGKFNIRTVVTNTQKATGLPFTYGWHPYFIVSDVSQAVVTFDKCTKWNHLVYVLLGIILCWR